MSAVIIGFSTTKKFNLLSWLIKKAEHTPFSHVYLKFYSTSLNKDLIYQASGLQINFVGSVLFSDHHEIIKEYSIPITEEENCQILSTCIDMAGLPYGSKQLLGMAWVRLMSTFGKKVTNPFADGSKTYICSELAGYILVKYFNYKIEDLDNISPKDIYLLLQEHGETRKIQN